MFSSLTVIAYKVAITASVIWIFFKLIQRQRRKIFYKQLGDEWGCKAPPRKVTKDPFFGCDQFFEFLIELKKHNILESTRALFTEHGYTFSSQFFGNYLIVTIEPENIKSILSLDFESFVVQPLRYPLEPVLGDGIFISDGAKWHQSRNLLRPMFTRSQLADFSIFELHVDRFLSKMPLNGQMIDLQPLFFALTLDISSHVFIGQSTDCQVADGTITDGTKFAAAFNRILTAFGDGSQIDIMGVKWPNPQFTRDCKFVKEFIDSYIIQAIEDKRKGILDDKAESEARSIFLHELVTQTDDVVQIRGEILSTVVAGRDTTASAMSDLWFELSKHPHVFAKLKAEVDSISGQEITMDLLKSMRYLRAVVNENLRLHPVVPDNGRVAINDTKLPVGGGEDGKSPILVPKGSVVAFPTYSMHRNRTDFFGDRTDEFVPERWLDTETSKAIRPGWAYLPFNGGPRICLGQQFALAQISYVSVRLLQMIDTLESCDPAPWQEKFAITATGLNGCKVSMTSSFKSI